jgi:hypothetical protein
VLSNLGSFDPGKRVVFTVGLLCVIRQVVVQHQILDALLFFPIRLLLALHCNREA